MAKTYISLESFVNNYVKNLELKNRPTDYATYLINALGVDDPLLCECGRDVSAQTVLALVIAVEV